MLGASKGGGGGLAHNITFYIPLDEEQTNDRAELSVVLYVVEAKVVDRWLVVIMDSKWTFKGLAECSLRWEKGGWRCKKRA